MKRVILLSLLGLIVAATPGCIYERHGHGYGGHHGWHDHDRW
jgi:hypothetical protein